MLSRLRFALFLPLAALLACSGSGNTVSTPATANTGDYVIIVAGGTAQASIFTGALTVSGLNVTGVFRYTNPGTICVSSSQDIPFTGTMANGTLTLTSSTFSSSIATLSLPLPFGNNTSNQQVSTGTAVITGGTCALASTSAKAQYIPSLAGTYSGTLTGPVTGNASATITEAAANADGQFPATIAIDFSSTVNSACNFSIPASASAPALISGATLQATFGNISVTVNAGSPPSSFSVSYAPTTVGTTVCGGTYTGTLTD